MKSFPSSFNRGGNSQYFTGKHEIFDRSKLPKSAPEQLINIQAKNINNTQTVKELLFNQVDATQYDRYFKFNNEYSKEHTKDIIFENPQFIPSWVLRSMNNYRGIFNKQLKSKIDAHRSGETMLVSIAATDVSPALFNPQFMVQAVGMTQNVPLLTNMRPTNSGAQHLKDIGDCRIEKLISDSLYPQSPLGMARYRLVDFMFCKDLGKVSNNHLITLRKFPFPVSDHVFQFSGPKYVDKINSSDTPGDVGRLLAWFGTDDNKLEDICKFETQATWKEIQNKIQEIDSKENNQERGPLGKIINSVYPAYNKYAEATGNGSNSILADLGSKLIPGLAKESTDNNDVFRMSADNNKVYTPKNTVQDNHIYEGKLILKQEITVNFSYKLRAYENINPKSAFLDLMGNILEVTFQRGRYWKGETRMMGSPQNRSGWQKANALIDNAWNKLGGFIEAMAAGTINFNDILGAVSNMIGEAAQAAGNLVSSITEDPKAAGKELAKNLQELNKATGFSYGVKALLKNQLGRPAMYAMDSLISGDDMGCWHLTVGNPYNPIMSIGNLILTSSTVTHSGALGVDDFPSEIKVTCSLKPARSRDSTGIARYYTKGMNSLYLPTHRNDSSDFYSFDQFSSVALDKEKYAAQQANMGKTASKDTTTPDDGAHSTEYNPSQDLHEKSASGYTVTKTDAQGKTYTEFDDSKFSANSGEWQGLQNEEQVKIFSLNNWSMAQWNIANDEIG